MFQLERMFVWSKGKPRQMTDMSCRPTTWWTSADPEGLLTGLIILGFFLKQQEPQDHVEPGLPELSVSISEKAATWEELASLLIGLTY